MFKSNIYHKTRQSPLKIYYTTKIKLETFDVSTSFRVSCSLSKVATRFETSEQYNSMNDDDDDDDDSSDGVFFT